MALRFVLLLLAWLALPPEARAETAAPRPEDKAAIDACLRGKGANVQRHTDCIGAVMAPCRERPGGDTTYGLVTCAKRELAVWDGLLNAAYKALQPQLDRKQRGELRDVQRLWITWRDRKCGFDRYLYEGGSIVGPLVADCVNAETARRTIELRALHRDLTNR
ncbi:MAG: DUF1311 domain-containing protein [Hyphomicrobiaceae bacterium]|nr:DUF1311 domain-containing protein [Hyphomicrobiaceae bacterium]